MIIRTITIAAALAAIIIFGISLANASCANIQQLAQEHSNDMARRHSMDHAGFSSRAHRGAHAENVALAGSEGQALKLWRESPPHAANMLLPGCHAVAHSGRYYTMEIGP